MSCLAVIALCGQRQALRRSLGLMAEMRSRNIAANVHTYSALMNVCIKCGELDLALDVFNQLQVCTTAVWPGRALLQQSSLLSCAWSKRGTESW